MGDFFVGGGYQSTMRGIKQANGTFTENALDDAAISAGFGLGDATNGIGFSTVITSLSLRSGFANSTAFSFQVFRKINPTLAVAVGVENAIISGGENTEGADSWYGVASKVFQQPAADVAWLKSVTVSAGFGNGRFRTADDISIGNETVMVFASVSATVHDQVSVIGEFTGQDVNLGLSVVPVRKFPVAITMALADLTGAASESARLIIGAGLVVRY